MKQPPREHRRPLLGLGIGELVGRGNDVAGLTEFAGCALEEFRDRRRREGMVGLRHRHVHLLPRTSTMAAGP